MQRADAQMAQLKQQLASAQDRNRELRDEVSTLEGALESKQHDAAQRNVADASTAAEAQRAADEVQKLRRQVAAAQQELSEARREKETAVAQVQSSAMERQRGSEELSKAAKAMILAQVRQDPGRDSFPWVALLSSAVRIEVVDLAYIADVHVYSPFCAQLLRSGKSRDKISWVRPQCLPHSRCIGHSYVSHV